MAVVLFRSPKTASTSIGDTLDKALGLGVRAFRMEHGHSTFLDRFESALPDYDFIHTWSVWFHGTMAKFGKVLMEEHHVVTSMRNPYARFISGWAYSQKNGWINDDVSPRGLIEMPLTALHKDAQHHAFRPQVQNLYFKGTLHVHQVIRFEHVNTDFADLANRLDLSGLELPRLNVSKHRPWREYYEEDPGLRELVEASTPEDFATLPYTFDRDEPTGALPWRLRQ